VNSGGWREKWINARAIQVRSQSGVGRVPETSPWRVVNIEPRDVKKRDMRLGDIEIGLMEKILMKT
jgi:hypothetical protein